MRTRYLAYSSDDRLTPALALAVLVHAVVILGVTFEPPELHDTREPLEITLEHAPAAPPPKKASFLAPENHRGSGTSAKPEIPHIAAKAPAGGIATPEGDSHAKPAAATQRQVVAAHAPAPHKAAKTPPQEENRHGDNLPKLDMASVQQQIAEYSAELAEVRQTYAQRPKILYVNSVTAHKYEAAAYEKAWQQKIERIGNLNYPDAARRQHLSGSLLLSVAVRSDGSLHSIKLRQSSDSAVLDDAAKRIVRLAAPFAPFPPGLKEEADVLVITRTWKFFSDSHLATAP